MSVVSACLDRSISISIIDVGTSVVNYSGGDGGEVSLCGCISVNVDVTKVEGDLLVDGNRYSLCLEIYMIYTHSK